MIVRRDPAGSRARRNHDDVGISDDASLQSSFSEDGLTVAAGSDHQAWAAKFNPVNWAAEAGRSAAGTNADWGLIASRAGFLALLLLASAAFATRAFNDYQRSA
jgi:ABC-2 type transport system permease protein